MESEREWVARVFDDARIAYLNETGTEPNHLALMASLRIAYRLSGIADLLAACEAALDCIHSGNIRGDANEVMESLIAAIAKARGS